MLAIFRSIAVCSGLCWVLAACSESDIGDPKPSDQKAFEEVAGRDWREVFFDSGTGDWKERWFLDGEVGTVENGLEWMTLKAGPEPGNDAHHMVLWTKQSFEGDLKIEYEYTRLDEQTKFVNILYIQATGNGIGPYAKDIAAWNELRRVPAMRMYYNYMNTYHISYAAFPNNEDTTSYIRARRYKGDESGIQGSELKPDYFPEDLFKPGVPHRITVVKREREINLRVENAEQVLYCRMTNPDLPAITEGRIGLRHMFTRSARYKNFRVYKPAE